MSDWRENASEEAQDDLDRLAEVTLAAARSFLDLEGEFSPFPMAIKADGVLAPIGLQQPATPVVLDANEIMANVVEVFRERRGSLRALAIGADVVMPEDVMPDELIDAIEIRLEHREGIAITILVPYQIDSLDDTYLYDEPRIVPGDRVIWD